MKKYFKKNKEENFDSIISGKHPINELDIYFHQESGFKNLTILAIPLANQDIRSRRIEEIKVFKKSKFKEVED
jgi:hypothetical protein